MVTNLSKQIISLTTIHTSVDKLFLKNSKWPLFWPFKVKFDVPTFGQMFGENWATFSVPTSRHTGLLMRISPEEVIMGGKVATPDLLGQLVVAPVLAAQAEVVVVVLGGLPEQKCQN